MPEPSMAFSKASTRSLSSVVAMPRRMTTLAPEGRLALKYSPATRPKASLSPAT